MTKVYLIRHCEAMGNVNRVVQGIIDLDISKTGEKQLKYLSERMGTETIDFVYASPMLRTVKTARSFAEPKGISVKTEDGLKEHDCGILEGRPFAEFFREYPDLADAWDHHPQDFSPEGGEPMRLAYDRIWETVCALARENVDKNIAVVSHGGVLRCLACRLMFGTVENLAETPWCDNTSVSLIEFDREMNPVLRYYNDHSHLPDDLLPAKSKPPASTDEVGITE